MPPSSRIKPINTCSVPMNICCICSLGRSEEHTSELQSLAYLVCRLLLEKKKNITAKRRAYRPPALELLPPAQAARRPFPPRLHHPVNDADRHALAHTDPRLRCALPPTVL